MQSRMLLIWAGALLVIAGVVYTAAQGIWRSGFSQERHAFTARGFGLKANWPGLAMIAVGAFLLLGVSAI